MATTKPKRFVLFDERICHGCGRTYSIEAYRKTQRYCSIRCVSDSKVRHVQERFWEKVLKAGPDECWAWTGALSPLGYGRFRGPDGKTVVAHRMAFLLVSGPIPRGLCACHSCDNPSCVNPLHIFLGTQADNIADMYQKGRARNDVRAKGEDHHGAKLTERAVREIRTLATSVSRSQLARQYGVSRRAIRSVIDWSTWRHVA